MVNPLEKIEKEQLRDLLSRCWMTHDAMWFFHSLQEVGIDKTNKINRAAVWDMAAFELRRIRKALGRAEQKPLNFADFKSLFEEVFELVKADFIKGLIEYPGDNVMRFTMQQCFAHDGISRMGIIDRYQCGIFHRIESWFTEIGLTFEVSPKVDVCMMITEGKCYREYRFFF